MRLVEAVYWVSPDGQTMGGPFRVPGNPNRIIVGPDNNIWVAIATSPHVVVLSPQGLPVREFLVFPGPTDIAALGTAKCGSRATTRTAFSGSTP